MQARILIWLAINGSVAMAASGKLPSWIVDGSMSDASYYYVVCSHDGIDPEEARQIAESKCLASAAKLGGVNVHLTQKTVQSLTGSDSSEVAEIQPLEGKIKCEWTDRFLEEIKDGFRVWLRCKVSKASIMELVQLPEKSLDSDEKSTNHAEAVLVLAILPKPDRLIIVGTEGERVIVPTSNIISISVSSLDQKVEVKKAGYKSKVIDLTNDFLQGGRIQRDVVLDRE